MCLRSLGRLAAAAILSSAVGCALIIGVDEGTSRVGCDAGSECESAVCVAHECQAPSCTDEVKNGDETDVDCGGGCPTRCASGRRCVGDSDCASGDCRTNKVCR